MKILGVCLFFILLFIPGAVFAQLEPTRPKGMQNKLLTDDQLVRYGRYLFKLGSCLECHTEKGGLPLAGGYKMETPFGVFYTPNISSDKETGIGQWSDDDFIRALRHGKTPNGDYYYPTFPYSSYAKMSDTDMIAIKRYIFSLKPVSKKNKSHQLKFPYNIRSAVAVWRFSNFLNLESVNEFNFYKSKNSFKTIENKSWEWNRGAYLAEAILHCSQCHSPRDLLGNFKWNEWMSGSLIAGGGKPATNISSSISYGLGKWTKTDWDIFLTDGVSPNSTEVSGKMGDIVEHATSLLFPSDLDALITYLKELKPIDKDNSKNKKEKDLISQKKLELYEKK